MKLPNPANAIISSGKIEGYALNLNYSEGRHKALVFRSALNMGIEDAEELKMMLRRALREKDALITKRNTHGQKYQIDFKVVRQGKSAFIRSVWIIRNDDDFPRLVTCYVL